LGNEDVWVEVGIHLFLIMAPDAPANFLNRKIIQYPLNRRMDGPRASPEAKEKQDNPKILTVLTELP